MAGETLIAYLIVIADEARASYVGGIMVADGRGLPVEFRYTQPIRPSRLQRVLYGGALDGYVRRDVIATRLLRDLEHKPAGIVVREDTLLALGVGSAAPVLHVFQSNLDQLGRVGSTKEVDASSVLIQLAEGRGPVRVTVATEDATLLTACRDLLLTAAATMDPLEPLIRVEEAIELLCEEAANSSTT